MLSFPKKYYFYGILGLIGVLSIIAFEPTLTAWLFRQTAPPVKVYKAAPLEERENSNQIQATQRSDAEKQSSLEQKHPSQIDGAPTVTEFHQNGNFDNNQASDETTTIERVPLPPPKRTPKKIPPKGSEIDNRLRDLEAEMRAIVDLANEDRDIMLRFLDLEEEFLNIHKARGTLHVEGISPFLGIKIDRLMASFSDGKIPVSMGEELASLYAEYGLHDQAKHIRAVTQRAIENGDSYYKAEHLEGN